jgi:hypothetical protein
MEVPAEEADKAVMRGWNFLVSYGLWFLADNPAFCLTSYGKSRLAALYKSANSRYSLI